MGLIVDDLKSMRVTVFSSTSAPLHQQHTINDGEPHRHPSLITLLALGPQQLPHRLIHQNLCPSLALSRPTTSTTPEEANAVHAELGDDFPLLGLTRASGDHDGVSGGWVNEVHEDVGFPFERFILPFRRVGFGQPSQERGDRFPVNVVAPSFSLGFEDESFGVSEGQFERRESGRRAIEWVEVGAGIEEGRDIVLGESSHGGRVQRGGSGSYPSETSGEDVGLCQDLLHLLAPGELQRQGRAFDRQRALNEVSGGPEVRWALGGNITDDGDFVVGWGVARAVVDYGDFDWRGGGRVVGEMEEEGVRGGVESEEGGEVGEGDAVQVDRVAVGSRGGESQRSGEG